MAGTDLFEGHAGEPLGLVSSAAETPPIFGDARCERFEYSSRGDRVPGRLLRPLGEGPAPIILLQHGLGGSKEAAYMDAAAPWIRGGAAVASVDLPLHGERQSAKLSQRLLTSFATAFAARDSAEVDPVSRALWIEFARQSVIDLRRCLDALERTDGVDAKRVAFAGFSLGAIVGSLLIGVEPRLRAGALALAGGGLGPAEVDPCRHIGRVAPRPLLFVNASRDERIPRSATEALYAAAGEPKSIEWFDSAHGDLPGHALKAMWVFLRAQLGIGSPPSGSGG